MVSPPSKEYFRKPMLEAILDNNLERIKRLMVEGVDFNAQFLPTEKIEIKGVTYSGDAQSYGTFALRHRKFDILSFMARDSFDMNQHLNDDKMNTLLTWYCENTRHQDIQAKDIRKLIDLGLRADATNVYGENALHLLTHQDEPEPYDEDCRIVDNSEKIDVLLGVRRNRRVDIDAQDKNGNTALHRAAASATPLRIVNLLLLRRARYDITNGDGFYAADLAENNPYQINAPIPLPKNVREGRLARRIKGAFQLSAKDAAVLNAAPPAVSLKPRKITVV